MLDLVPPARVLAHALAFPPVLAFFCGTVGCSDEPGNTGQEMAAFTGGFGGGPPTGFSTGGGAQPSAGGSFAAGGAAGALVGSGGVPGPGDGGLPGSTGGTGPVGTGGTFPADGGAGGVPPARRLPRCSSTTSSATNRESQRA
jgi:hypothetical protein